VPFGDQLEADLEHLRQRIRLHHAEFESFHTVSPLALEEVMARMPPDSVLVEYFTAGDEIWAFTVTAGAIKGTRLPLKVTELGRVFERSGGKLGQLRHLNRGPDQRLPHPWILEKLYHLLLEPLGRIVQTASLVCLVPHGLLHYVPFHALYQRTAAGPGYFVAGHSSRRMIYAPSATTLFGYCRRKRPSPQTGCLAIGYNDLSLSTPLTQAETEAEIIARITTGRSLTGEQAPGPPFSRRPGTNRYLHCSCHGWFNPTWPMASSLSLADGHLDVTDILRSLRLEADLVSLSACETGRSHILRGDELIGLIWAFLYDGTPSVLVSHWMVDELATRLLMEEFYRELIAYASPFEIGSKAKALGRAQKVIKELTVEELRD
jgi:CHAT domain-containing protein